MESKPPHSAREQLASLAASREMALGRILLPWRYVVGFAVVMNGALIGVVLPIFVSPDSWTPLIVQAAFLVAMLALLLAHKRRQVVRRPLLRVRGAQKVTAVSFLGGFAALAVGIYASITDNPWLGAAALLINFASYLVLYGGLRFLFQRQVAQLL